MPATCLPRRRRRKCRDSLGSIAATHDVLSAAAISASLTAGAGDFVHERTRACRSDRGRLCAAARCDRRQQSEALPGRHLVPVFRAPAPRGPGALHQGRHVRLVLVGDQVQGHHVGRDEPPDLLVRGDAGRHLDHRPADGIPPRQLHLDGPAEARRAAQGGLADRGADEPEQAVGDDPRARRRHPRCAAAQRDVRLGAARLDRADHPDADDADGLPVRGSPQAGLLVGLRDRRRERRHGRRFRGEAAGDPDRGAGVLHRALA